MIIAVQGCLHGNLDELYESVDKLAVERDVKVDLLICCGDFESLRNEPDLQCMAGPAHQENGDILQVQFTLTKSLLVNLIYVIFLCTV